MSYTDDLGAGAVATVHHRSRPDGGHSQTASVSVHLIPRWESVLIEVVPDGGQRGNVVRVSVTHKTLLRWIEALYAAERAVPGG